MTRHGQGIVVAVAVILAISLAAGGVIVLAGTGSSVVMPAPNVIKGGNGPNRLIGTHGPDDIYGRGAGDLLKGRGGDDLLKGQRGGDRINGGAGFDRMLGGRGADRLAARDGHSDEIDCGAGKDLAIVDRHEDGVFDCERVRTPKRTDGKAR